MKTKTRPVDLKLPRASGSDATSILRSAGWELFYNPNELSARRPKDNESPESWYLVHEATGQIYQFWVCQQFNQANPGWAAVVALGDILKEMKQ